MLDGYTRSGVKNGNLSTAVSGLEIVNAAGEVVKLSRETRRRDFQGAWSASARWGR